MISAFILLLSSVFVHANAIHISNVKIVFKIPYTLGTHFAKVDKLNATIVWDEKISKISKAEVVLHAEDILLEDKKLKCHLLESLTLNYDKSDYPEQHVCENNQLPTAGKNSSEYPDINAKLKTALSLSDKEAEIEWDIHGVKKDLKIPVSFELSESRKSVIIKSQWEMSRSDFGIVVKRFLFIDADDRIPVELSLEGKIVP